MIAYTTLPLKVGRSHSKVAKTVVEMFIELLSTHSPCQVNNEPEADTVEKSINLLNRYISYPSLSGESHLEGLLTGLYCIQAINLCSSLLLQQKPVGKSLSFEERYRQKKKSKYQQAISAALLAEKSSGTSIKILCPPCAEICGDPFLFAEVITSLKLYESKYTRYVLYHFFLNVNRKFGPDRRDEVRRVIQEITQHFDRTFRLAKKNSIHDINADFYLLYAGFLQGTGKFREVCHHFNEIIDNLL